MSSSESVGRPERWDQARSPAFNRNCPNGNRSSNLGITKPKSERPSIRVNFATKHFYDCGNSHCTACTRATK